MDSELTINWNFLRAEMEDAPWSAEARAAGLWAIDTLQEQLGPRWPKAWSEPGSGPPGLLACTSALAGLVSTLDMALALSLLADLPGMRSVRNTIRRNSRADLLASPRLQLRIGCLALTKGFNVGIEPLLQGAETRADLEISSEEVSIGIEALAVLRDEKTLKASAWLDTVRWELHQIGEQYAVEFSGAIDGPLDESETVKLLAELKRYASSVAVGLELPVLRRGGVSIEVARTDAPGRSNFRMPVVSFGERMGDKLQKKVSQTKRSHATWLLIDSLDHLWHMTHWAQNSLAEKAKQLADFFRIELGHAGHIDGVVISDGAALMRPEVEEESVVLGDGTIALCRIADNWHARESVIVPLHGEALIAAETWREVLDSESGWLSRGLQEAKLQPIPELMSVSG